MRPRILMLGLIIGAAMLWLASYAGRVSATPAHLFGGTTIAQARFGDIDITHHLVREFGDATPRKDLWLSLQKTKGPSDLFVQSNTWEPGGHTGWHTHPGHSLIIVTEGVITAYEGDDPACAGTEYHAGSGFVDPGGAHVHNLRNEGVVTARTVAVQLIPAGAMRRIDRPAPANCSF